MKVLYIFLKQTHQVTLLRFIKPRQPVYTTSHRQLQHYTNFSDHKTNVKSNHIPNKYHNKRKQEIIENNPVYGIHPP